MKTTSFVLSLIILSFSSLACDDGGGKSAPKLALAEVEDEYYNLFCEKVENCDMNAYFSMVIDDRQDCLDFLHNNMNDGPGIGDIVAAVNAGTVAYDAEQGYACIEDMRALSCAEFGDREPASCVGVFTGTLADDDECNLNEECVSGYCNTDAGCPGTCEPAVAVGDPCTETDECEAGAKCVLDECAVFSAAAGVGDPCDADEDWCGEGLFCHPTTGECTAQLTEGTDCENVSDQECEAGTLCFGVGDAQKTCVELTIIETADTVCDYGAGIMCAAYNDLTCAIDDFQAFTGTCQTFTTLGEVCFNSTELVLTSCDMFADLFCDMSGGYQTDGHCTAKKSGGEACTDGDQCLSGLCTADLCADEDDICR